MREVRRGLEYGRPTGGGPPKASFLVVCGVGVAVVPAPPMIVGLRCKSHYTYGVRKSRAAWREIDGTEDQARREAPGFSERREGAAGGRRLRRRARDRVAQHAQARRSPRGGGDVAVQPRGQQG